MDRPIPGDGRAALTAQAHPMSRAAVWRRIYGRCTRAAGGLCLALAAGDAGGATFPLPGPDTDLVGETGTAIVAEGETLLDIARAHDLGYNEITAANPGLDPWLPPPGATVILPTRFLLPAAPRRGIVVNVAEMRLYYYPESNGTSGGEADSGGRVVLTFPIGIGQEGWTTPLGVTEVVSRVKDPAWTVPESIRAEHARNGDPLPDVVPPGPDNPLGAYALRLGLTRYLIHGTNRPYGIGRRTSHGCLRLYPEDIEALFRVVPVATPVWIIDQPYKLGRGAGRLWLEAHAPIVEPGHPPADYFTPLSSAIDAVIPAAGREDARVLAAATVKREDGIPAAVAELPPAPQGGWMLQLGAFARQRNAARLAEELRAQGIAVTVSAGAADGYCHVLAGPYADRAAALAGLAEIRQGTGYTGIAVAPDRSGPPAECPP
jgi:L,D-transpeptidase ErfK/SrfK